MYRPPFQLPTQVGTDLFPKEMQAPPIARIAIPSQVERVDNATLKAIMEEARLTLRDNAGDITNFFNAQRQNAQIAGLPQYRKTRAFGDIYMDYINANGTESISLYIKPSIPKVTLKDTSYDLDVPSFDVLDVRVEFRYWPIPGSQAYGNPAEGWGRLTDTVAWYDPFYEHDSIENPLIAADSDPGAMPEDDLRRNVYYSAFVWSIGGDDLTPQNRVGFDETLYLRKEAGVPVGKTGIYPELLSGAQYWETEIVAIPEDVPESYSYGEYGVRYGNVTDKPVTLIEDGVTTIRFPAELNTFFNPVIGLAPKYFKELSFDNGTRMSSSMLGLDPRLSEPRSIYGFRTSTMRGDVRVDTFVEGGIYVDTTGVTAEFGGAGRHFLCELNPVDDRVSGEPYPADVARSLASRHTRGGTVFEVRQVNGSYAQDAGGPVDGNEVNTHNNPVSGTSDYDAGSWFGWHQTVPPTVDYSFQSNGTVGGPFYPVTSLVYYPGESDPAFRPSVSGSTIVRVEHSVSSETFPDVLYGDYVIYDVDLDTERVMVPLDQEGVNFPVLKGRGDFLAYYRSDTIPDEEPSYTVTANGGAPATDWKADNGTGIDTGVNLGEIAVGDRIMIATNTESRKVWFGRNGVWYGPTGEITEEDIRNGEGYATLMDVVEDRDPEYYPAATVKYGFTHVRMHLGTSCRYTPPAGHRLVASPTNKLRVDTGKVPD